MHSGSLEKAAGTMISTGAPTCQDIGDGLNKLVLLDKRKSCRSGSGLGCSEMFQRWGGPGKNEHWTDFRDGLLRRGPTDCTL